MHKLNGRHEFYLFNCEYGGSCLTETHEIHSWFCCLGMVVCLFFLALISCIHKLNVIVRRHVEKSGWLGISLWNVVHYFRNLSPSCPEKQHPLLPTLHLQNTENENIHQGTNLYVLNYSVQRLFTGYFICSITEARLAEWTTDVKLNWNAFAGIEIHRVQRILSMVKKNSSYLEKYQVF